MHVEVEYYEYDCGRPCTPSGCPGHPTDIPVAVDVNGFTLELRTYASGDFPHCEEPRKLDLWIRTVRAVAAALEAAPEVLPNLSIPDPPEPPDSLY